MAKRKKSNLPQNDFACEEDLDVCSFTSEPITTGECISSFSFDDKSSAENIIDFKSNTESTPKNNLINNTVISSNQHIQSKNTISEDNRKSPIVNGLAPPINGEFLDVKRTYMLRASTVRKINELKSVHPELNTYVSTIVDMAINHYYKHIVHEGGTQ